ncbi:MAG: efflux transporter outer membrane subunit [Dokdonella sp.]
MGIRFPPSIGWAGRSSPRIRRVRVRAVFLLGILGALCVLAGCAVAPLPRLDDRTPQGWQHAFAPDDAPAADLRSWWTAFHDPQLDRLIDKALADNLTIRQAALRIDASRALAGSASAVYLPQVGAHTFSEPAPDSSASYFQVGFDAKWELGLFGRAQSRARVTAADLRIAQSDAQAARVSVVAEVVRAYASLRGAQQRLALLQQMTAIAADRITLTTTRLRLRLASTRELAQAQAEQASAEAALAEPRLAIDRTRQQLAVLLAQDKPDVDLAAPVTPLQLGDIGIATAPADLLRTRPEIRHAENDVLKAAGELGLARADRFPRVGLGGSLTYSSRVIGHTRLADADGIATFGPAIDIPLFDWGARRAVQDARDAELSASLLAYRQSVLEGLAEVETAMATLEHSRERTVALARVLASLERGDAVSATLQRVGLADDRDRATASIALVQARLDLAQTEQERNVAFVALYKALGGAPLPVAESQSVPSSSYPGRGKDAGR